MPTIPQCSNLPPEFPADACCFRSKVKFQLARGVDSEGGLLGRLIEGDSPARWASAEDIPLFGRHNVSNILAACLAAVVAGVEPGKLSDALRSFRGLPHRLQPVAERDGVLWVNDSKATNVSAAVAAVNAFDRPVVLLLGGRHKGQPYTTLAKAARERARLVIAFGEAAPLIVSELRDAVETIVVESSLDSAVKTAADLAQPGDVVLLAPACSSYDMFPNYLERGRAFEAAVLDLQPAESAS